MNDPADSAQLIWDSVLVIAGACLLAGVLIGVVLVLVLLDRRDARMDVVSMRRADRARAALGRVAGR